MVGEEVSNMILAKDNNCKRTDNLPKGNEKKPYVTPRIEKYGQLEKLTQGTGGFKGDGGAGKSRLP